MLVTLSSSSAPAIITSNNSITFTNELPQILEIPNRIPMFSEKRIKIEGLSIKPWPQSAAILTVNLVEPQIYGNKSYRNIISLVDYKNSNYSKPMIPISPGVYDKITVKLSTIDGSDLNVTSVHVQFSIEE